MYLLVSALAAISVSAATQTMACTSFPSSKLFTFKSVAKDCSFKNAGRGASAHADGDPVVDMGNGMVRQDVTIGSDACNSHETLVVIDCPSGQGVLVDGKATLDGPVIAGAWHTDVENILKPRGPIDLSSESTIDGLRKIAQDSGLDASTDLRAFYRKNSSMKRIDYRCGCKLYYPNSRGAKK